MWHIMLDELAKALNLNSDVIEIVRQAALLHDIGKIGISEHFEQARAADG